MVILLIRIPGFDVGIIIIKTKAVAIYLDAPDQLYKNSGLALFGGVYNAKFTIYSWGLITTISLSAILQYINYALTISTYVYMYIPPS